MDASLMGLIKTQDEVYDLARSVGFNHDNARIASAIALCEAPATLNNAPASNFGAVGDKELADDKWGYSYGGFQIRSLRADAGTGRIRDAERLDEPRFNAKSARAIRLSSGWRAWTTFTNGAYKAYLQDLFPPPKNAYVVVGGDTLSKIGTKVGVTWQDLARWNGIHSPYTIYIGQIIFLIPPTVGA
jgi:hypothetical protein